MFQRFTLCVGALACLVLCGCASRPRTPAEIVDLRYLVAGAASEIPAAQQHRVYLFLSDWGQAEYYVKISDTEYMQKDVTLLHTEGNGAAMQVRDRGIVGPDSVPKSCR